MVLSPIQSKKQVKSILKSLKKSDFIKFIQNNKNGEALINYLKPDIKLSAIKLKKIDNVIKLLYKLFLYSILGFFAKIITRFLKI